MISCRDCVVEFWRRFSRCNSVVLGSITRICSMSSFHRLSSGETKQRQKMKFGQVAEVKTQLPLPPLPLPSSPPSLPHPCVPSVDTLIDGTVHIYLSRWNRTITRVQIITSLRIAPASLHSQLLLCVCSHKHSAAVPLMGLLAADQNRPCK